MTELLHDVGDIREALETLHRNPNSSTTGNSISIFSGYKKNYISTAHLIEQLVKLEAEFGPPPAQEPALNEVLNYLTEV